MVHLCSFVASAGDAGGGGIMNIEAWLWPQYTMAVITVLTLSIAPCLHDKQVKYNAPLRIILVMTEVIILGYGGFWK